MKNPIAVCILSLVFLTACSTKSVFVGGGFYGYDGQKALGIMTIWNQGAKQTWFDPGTGLANAIAPSAAFTVELNANNDRIYLGGIFTQYNGQPANRIVAVDRDGKNLEGISFKGGDGFNGPVHVIARDPNYNDSYFVGGEFTSYKGNPAPGIILIKGNGDIDSSFNPGTGVTYTISPNPARVVAVAFDTKNMRTCFGGSFTSYKNVLANNFICIGSKGEILPGFNSGGSGFTHIPESSSYEGEVDQIEIDEDNDKIFVGGRFNRYNDTQVTHNLVRLGINGNFEMDFELVGQSTRRALFILVEHNAIITGGESYKGVNYNSLIKIDRESGDLVPEFAVVEGNIGSVLGLGTAALIDGENVNPGKIFYAGTFNFLSPTTGKSVTHYNLQEELPLLRIDKTTGAIDQNFFFKDDLAVQGGTAAANIRLLRAFKK
jgi:hypothetical protein